MFHLRNVPKVKDILSTASKLGCLWNVSLTGSKGINNKRHGQFNVWYQIPFR